MATISFSSQPWGRILILPPERGRSPPAASRSVEVVWSIPEPFHQLCCCGPGLRRAEVASATQAGRSAVRRWRYHAPIVIQMPASLCRMKPVPASGASRFVGARPSAFAARHSAASARRRSGRFSVDEPPGSNSARTAEGATVKRRKRRAPKPTTWDCTATHLEFLHALAFGWRF